MTSSTCSRSAQAQVALSWQPVSECTDATAVAAVLDLPVLTVLGVEIRSGIATPDRQHDAVVSVRRTAGGDYVITVPAATWHDAQSLAVVPLLGVVAHLAGHLYLRCTLLQFTQPSAVSAAVVVLNSLDTDWPRPPALPAAGPHIMIDAQSYPPTATVLQPEQLWQSTISGSPQEVAAVAIRAADAAEYIPSKTLRVLLAANCALFERDWVGLAAGERALDLIASIHATQRTQLDSLAAAAHSVRTTDEELLTWSAYGDTQQLIGSAPAQYPREGVDGLRLMQETAAQVYGRYDPDSAFVWFTEELGELANAVRRGESPARIQQELGQYFSWILCLANITGIDLADAAVSAIDAESRRQVATYGHLRPYSRPGSGSHS